MYLGHTKNWFLSITLFVMDTLCSERVFICVVLQILVVFLCLGICSARTFSANFVFGDSLVEVGNNNYIVSLSKADYPPNGIDFGKPTGRFTNGRTIADILGKLLFLQMQMVYRIVSVYATNFGRFMIHMFSC